MTDKPNIKPITADDPEAASPDIVSENLEKLKSLFPEAVTEDGVNVDVLNQLIGKTVTDSEEKYGLTWHGKRKARQLALTPSTGTLRPCPEESVDWDTTQNLFIEGDNLEVLKLLQKSYANKVKMIYIDPPYNTGGDFVYPDDFKDNIQNYQTLMGWRTEEGKAVSSKAKYKNTENSGRYHTDWLNMMYPRLKVARNLLRDDGVIFISIDDNEVKNLQAIMDDIFGEENHLQQIVWKRHAGGGNDSKYFAVDHEYLIAFAKNKSSIERLRQPLSDEDIVAYRYKDQYAETLGPYKLKSFSRMRPDDPRPTLTYDIITPDGTIIRDTWKWEEVRFLQALKEEKVQLRKDRNGKWQVEYKIYLKSIDDNEEEAEEKTKVPRSLFLDVERNAEGKKQLRETIGHDNIFNNPKPIGLIEHLSSFALGNNDIIIDFFAGSCATAHAILDLNHKDCGNRKFIMVQLPEHCDKKSEAYKAGFKTIAEIGKERIRRAGAKILEENKGKLGFDPNKLDVGFKVFKLDTSNIRAWNPDPDDLEGTLHAHTEHLAAGRSEPDVLYELLLKLGLDLAVPIEQKQIGGKNVHAIGAGTLFACLAESVTREDVETIAQGIIDWHKELAPEGETTIVFRDSGFADDVAKSNMAAIFVQAGFDETRIRSL